MTGTNRQTQPEHVICTPSAFADAEAGDRIAALLAGRANYQQEIRRLVQDHSYVVFYGCGAILNSIVESWTERIGRPIDSVATATLRSGVRCSAARGVCLPTNW